MIKLGVRKLTKLVLPEQRTSVRQVKYDQSKDIEISLVYSLQRKTFAVCHIQSVWKKAI